VKLADLNEATHIDQPNYVDWMNHVRDQIKPEHENRFDLSVWNYRISYDGEEASIDIHLESRKNSRSTVIDFLEYCDVPFTSLEKINKFAYRATYS
jgi:uncharacterized SAM-dependent methyltransferase